MNATLAWTRKLENLGLVSRPSFRPRTKPQKFDPFLLFCQAHKFPMPETEFRFDPIRRWRLDYAWPDRLVGLEQEGGIFTAGRHTRGRGYLSDMAKYNAAVLAGWTLLRFTPDQIRRGDCLEALRQVLS
jgi:hypothetical protein